MAVTSSEKKTAESIVIPPAGHGKTQTNAAPGKSAPQNLSAETAPASAGLAFRTSSSSRSSQLLLFASASVLRHWCALVASIA